MSRECVCGAWGNVAVLNGVVRKILTEQCQLNTVQCKGVSHWHKYSKQRGREECKFTDSDSGCNFNKDGESGGYWQSCVMI